ncbi:MULTISPECIES: putative bifunctional diguanylate cyclase/phosphodiesterase [Hyphomonas]|mgnify:FL=1|uniref:GGDEF-domain containing protein n=1 Tax=Hyphomonas adhaerens TaxID=81029 RepID=A0A3B9H1Q7_9PROT|nr:MULTISPECIES: EAL domain-containing protein [Hyphomonas]MBB39182.1 GGDEF-domain containing protein [Hyphomonas sp.]HAE28386.1 GGDEF-domain containing protein [Hyphomonas adhaerens]|tara:strand:- start:3295 stop:4923 length:1629 start_codon:yes stop_codon:yes gene_type:complete
MHDYSQDERADMPFWRSSPFLDAGWIIVFFGTILLFAIHLEAFEYVVDLSHQHESWELDEIMTTMMLLPIGLVIYAKRRLDEARAELRRRQVAETEASQMALHDTLTGLGNRRKAQVEISRALERAEEEPVTLISIDLNRFKPVNDLHGHAIGDELLLAAGARLINAAGPRASVYRFGGDEFCVLLPGAFSEDELLARVEAISVAFDRRFDLTDVSVSVGASVGATTTSDPNASMDELLSQADAAMYRCKNNGRNDFSFFESGMEVAALRRAKVEEELRQALAEDRIQAHFQPLVRLEDKTIIGYEALARWCMGDGTCREPDEFISIAEEAGLISDIFYVVLRKAAKAARTWPSELTFSVNLSPVQFNDPWLVERILQILVEEGIQPGRLDIEVTENALVGDFQIARDVLWSLKNQGIHISLDDFGTGYSSLRHLSELPFEVLKIDRSFIENLSVDTTSQTIVRTVTSMAHSLGLIVTAEGVNSVDNATAVSEFGCDIGQGFLFGRPEAVGAGRASPAANEDEPENEYPVSDEPTDPHRKQA